MHAVGRFDESALQTPVNYEKHSEGFTRVALADHSIPGCVHMGHGICQLAPGGWLAPHAHSYEEGFYILSGTTLVGIDGRNYQFGPGDFGLVSMGLSHAWRNVSPEPVRWLEMLSPQPRPRIIQKLTLSFLARNRRQLKVRQQTCKIRVAVLSAILMIHNYLRPPKFKWMAIGAAASRAYRSRCWSINSSLPTNDDVHRRVSSAVLARYTTILTKNLIFSCAVKRRLYWMASDTT